MHVVARPMIAKDLRYGHHLSVITIHFFPPHDTHISPSRLSFSLSTLTMCVSSLAFSSSSLCTAHFDFLSTLFTRRRHTRNDWIHSLFQVQYLRCISNVYNPRYSCHLTSCVILWQIGRIVHTQSLRCPRRRWLKYNP